MSLILPAHQKMRNRPATSGTVHRNDHSTDNIEASTRFKRDHRAVRYGGRHSGLAIWFKLPATNGNSMWRAGWRVACWYLSPFTIELIAALAVTLAVRL
jgi:hypothetical protein